MAISCEPVSEETSRPRSPRHDGLPRRSLRSLLAMTNTEQPTTLVITNLLQVRQSTGFRFSISRYVLSSYLKENHGYFFAYLEKAKMKNQIQNPKTRPMKINAMSFLPFDTFG